MQEIYLIVIKVCSHSAYLANSWKYYNIKKSLYMYYDDKC